MKITVEFDSAEEFLQHFTLGGVTAFPSEEARDKQKKLVEKTAELTPAEPLPEDPVEPLPFEETKKTEPKIDESYRVEVRKELADLNKLIKGNPAKALIAETGYNRLTDVPLELLPGLMKKAKEARDNA